MNGKKTENKIATHFSGMMFIINKEPSKKKKKEQKLNSISAGNILLMFHSLSLIHTHIKNSFIPFMHLQVTMQPDILQSESE